MPGILARALDRRAVALRSHPGAIEADWLRGTWWGSTNTRVGLRVDDNTAMGIGAVWACVRAISQDMASLPLILYEAMPDGGKRRATTNPVYRLLHDAPNPEMTSVEFRTTVHAHLELRGNAFINVVRDRSYRPIELWPLNPASMRVWRERDGSLRYLYRLASGEDRVLTAGRDLMHLRSLSLDGVMGASVISHARESIGLAMAAEAYGAEFFGNSSEPRGVLTAPKGLSDDALARLRDSWEAAHGGLNNAHRTALLEEGLDWKAIGLTNQDAQFLETRQFQLAEIARWFGIPPHVIGDLSRGTWGNVEQMELAYVKRTLMSRAVIVEQAIDRDLLAHGERRLFAEHLFDGQLRGDSQSRAEVYSKALQSGWMTTNEVRAKENLNPMAGGDVLRAPLYTAPLAGDDGQPAEEA